MNMSVNKLYKEGHKGHGWKSHSNKAQGFSATLVDSFIGLARLKKFESLLCIKWVWERMLIK